VVVSAAAVLAAGAFPGAVAVLAAAVLPGAGRQGGPAC
jgi:hypothetical protein